jgi:hypothetical protein
MNGFATTAASYEIVESFVVAGNSQTPSKLRVVAAIKGTCCTFLLHQHMRQK